MQTDERGNKKTVWVNIYPGNLCSVSNSQDDADRKGKPNRIGRKCYPVEIEIDMDDLNEKN